MKRIATRILAISCLAAGLSVVVAAVGAGQAAACAGCRNPNMPLTRLDAVELGAGEVRASAVVAATALHVIHPAGCVDLNACDEVPVQPRYLHDQRIYPGELRAVAEVGLGRGFAAEVQLPVRLVATTIQYSTPDGQPYTPLDTGVHHRDETLAGIGDPLLLGRWGTTVAGAVMSLRAGASLPLGVTRPNPFTLGDMGMRHQHIQFGTGTFDPLLGFDAAKQFVPLQVVAYGQAQASLYENKYGFRAGARFLGGAQVRRRLFATFTGGAGVDVLHEGAERWDGEILQDGNLGRTEVLASIAAMQSFGGTAVGLTARFPVWRHIVAGDEPQGSLSSPVMLSVTVSRTFGGH